MIACLMNDGFDARECCGYELALAERTCHIHPLHPPLLHSGLSAQYSVCKLMILQLGRCCFVLLKPVNVLT
jgi:hypothetical protein